MANKQFTKCKAGHYYKKELDRCPYCVGNNSSANTVVDGRTVFSEDNLSDNNKTRIIGGIAVNDGSPFHYSPDAGNRTVFGEEIIKEVEGKQVKQQEYRVARRLVGWLVTYSFDKMGQDFRLFEGRNVIGRDADCNITVHDKTMSGKHATILFKNDKFKIKDELSSHGTLLNGVDIEDDHVEIHDNDIIKLGETEFKFKNAL